MQTVQTSCGQPGRLLEGSEALQALQRSPHFQCGPGFDSILQRQLEFERKAASDADPRAVNADDDGNDDE